MTNYILDFENFFLPISLEKSTEELETVTHRHYGCVVCGNPTSKKNFCETCNKETEVKLVGEKEDMGTKDLFDIRRISTNEIDLPRVYMSKWVVERELKKPKVSEKMKIQNSKKLKDLFTDLIQNRQALTFKLIFKSFGKLNDGYVIPFGTNLLCLIADGNSETVKPEKDLVEQLEELKQNIQEVSRELRLEEKTV